ncbi:MAG TPA: ribosome recycling factor [Candidatus Dojkabacteria bacterium]|nr:ribosome recycling factor [Candidatus Dojkabacteria bacterium]
MFDFNQFQSNLDKCIEHLNLDLSQLHTGRATVELIEDIKVNAYGTTMAMKAVGTIAVADAKSLTVQPWDQTLLESISKGISASNLGFLPSIEGEIVRVKVPEMTEERRLEYVKVMKDKVEQARVSVRNVRQDGMKEIDQMLKEGTSEDEAKRSREEIEKRVKTANEKIEEIREKKEKDLMTI